MKKILFAYCYFTLHAVFGQTVTTIAGNGLSGYSGDGGIALASQVRNPGSVTFDNHGNFLFTDSYNHVIRKISPAGIITTIAGTGIAGYSGDGYQATNAKLNGPCGLAIDKTDNIIFADYDNNVLRKISPSGIITTIAGNGTAGYSGDGNAALLAELRSPYGVAVDRNGNIFFSDLISCVVRKINTSGIISTVAGTGTAGDSGEGGTATDAKLHYPGFIAIHPQTDELYIPVHPNKKVLKINGVGTIILVAGTGVLGNDGDGGPATNAKMTGPNSICFDTSGCLYIGDPWGHVIRKVDTSGIISTIAGTGTAGFNGDGGLGTATQLKGPNCGAFDKWGNLFFPDCLNQRIRRINFNPNTVEEVPYRLTGVHIYPNPTTSVVTIVANVVISSLTITNIFGQEVLSQRPGRKEVTIGIQALPLGFYSIIANGIFAGAFVK